jgi:DNA-binding LacI/PurR family transcriptional regulator
MKKRATIVDIARAVGVTDGTVSRALANDPRVRAETRERILQAAKELNYRPHLSARLFKQGITKNIGVYSEQGAWIFFHSYFGRLVAGLAEAAQREGEHLVFYLPPKDPQPIRSNLVKLEGLDALLDGRVDGAVVLGGDLIPPGDREMLKGTNLPVVFLSNNFTIPGFSQILSGARERTRKAADHLFSLGHRKIGLSGYYQDAHYMQASLKGLQESLTAHGAAFDEGLVAPPTNEAFFDPEDMRMRLGKLRKSGATAVISTEIVEALTFVQQLTAEGASVPGDLSVVSFGPQWRGIFQGEPPLSTFDADLGDYGRQCFEMFKAVRGGDEPRTQVMEWDLAPGGETLGPPGR